MTATAPTAQQTRTFAAVAREIREKWPNTNYAAKPYLAALCEIHSSEPNAPYLAERADGVVRGFLANAGQFRGDDARRLKAELKSMIGMK